MINGFARVKSNYRIALLSLVCIALIYGLVNAVFPDFSSRAVSSLPKLENNFNVKIVSDDDGNEILREEKHKYKIKNGHYVKNVVTYLPNAKMMEDFDDDSIIILTLVAGKKSYGGQNTFENFFKNTLTHFHYDYRKVSLGLLFTEETEYERVLTFLKNHFYDNKIEDEKKFNRVVLLYTPFLKDSVNRDSRHDDAVQKNRRTMIAKSRNFLVNNAVDNEQYTVSIDSDIVQVNPSTLEYFVDSGKDIIVPRILMGSEVRDYDYNSWKGERAQPTPEEYDKIRESQETAVKENSFEKYVYVPHDTENVEHLEKLHLDLLATNKKTPENTLVEIDSVGGAILFVKSEVFKYGIQFPPYYVIGADWDLPLGGYDGIETEGLCYASKILGYKCWAMPGLLAYHNSD